MININSIYNYIDNIPWNKYPTFSGDIKPYIDAFNTSTLPIKGTKIQFDDDVWDFNKCNKNNSSQSKFIFNDMPEEVKEYLKFFVLYRIIGRNKIPTIQVRYSNFKSLYLNICKRTSHKSLFLITTEDIQNEITKRKVSASTAHNFYEAAYQVYDFLFKYYKLMLPVDLGLLKTLGIKQKNLAKKNEDESKITNIPEKYFSIIFNKCLELMRNTKIDYSTRMTAALLVILSQTGLRVSDLISLKTTNLIEKKLVKSGAITHYIHYTSIKPSKVNSPLLEFDIFSNPITTEAYKLMIELRKNCNASNFHDYIYVLPFTSKCRELYPLSKMSFLGEYKKLMYKYLLPEATKEWEGINRVTYLVWDKKTKKNTKIMLSVPETRQYRVHLCTALYEKGVSLMYIKKYMGHLSEYMTGYYVRPKDTYQENITYSEKVIKEIVEEDITPLGGNLIGNRIKENIQNFIKDNGLNIKSDINAIMKELGDKVVIRGKTGGVCIKTSLIPCAQDKRSNQVLCAYNICPNLFHFYYMIDVTYLNFQTLQKTYSSMKSNQNKMASQKELNKLKDLVKNRLLPELDELEKEINKKGINTIINQHPSIIEIIEHRDDIRKEINLWMEK